MPVSFNKIPSDTRVPLFYAEMDNSAAGTFSQTYKALLVGQTLLTESINTPVLCSSEGQAAEKFGEGSMLRGMVKGFRKNNSSMSLYCLPLADDTSGVQATGSITISGSATAAGVLYLYIAGTKVPVGVNSTDSASTIATAIATKITADTSLPVTASASDGSVALTARHKGVCGNDIQLSLNLYGSLSGEETPAGLTVTFEAMAGGALNPALTTALANCGDEEFDFIIMPYTDATSLNAIKEFLDDTTGRWSYAKQLYGHCFTAFRGTVADSQTLGVSRNDQHVSIMAFYKSDTPVWEIAAEYASSAATSLANDPARPLQTLEIIGMIAPAIKDRFESTERNTLLWSGISTFAVQSGNCQIERVVTTYQKNAYGVADNSYLDVETMFTSAYIIRYLRSIITSKYGRHKLANDGTKFGEGQAVVTPNIIRAELICAYQELESLALVENADAFKEHLIVERDANDPNRINVLFPPDYINQLRVFALLNQFRLQY